MPKIRNERNQFETRQRKGNCDTAQPNFGTGKGDGVDVFGRTPESLPILTGTVVHLMNCSFY